MRSGSSKQGKRSFYEIRLWQIKYKEPHGDQTIYIANRVDGATQRSNSIKQSTARTVLRSGSGKQSTKTYYEIRL